MVVTADQTGVRCLSGFSQSMLKLVLSGKLPAAEQVTPLATLRAVLDDTRYDPVRVALAGKLGASSKYFAGYTFEPNVGIDGNDGIDGNVGIDGIARQVRVGSTRHIFGSASPGGASPGGGGWDDGADGW
jgi:hypothetical protein